MGISYEYAVDIIKYFGNSVDNAIYNASEYSKKKARAIYEIPMVNQTCIAATAGAQAASVAVTAGLLAGRTISYFAPLALQPLSTALLGGFPVFLYFIAPEKFNFFKAAFAFTAIQLTPGLTLPIVHSVCALAVASIGGKIIWSSDIVDYSNRYSSAIQGASFSVAGGYLAGRNIAMLSALAANSVGAALLGALPFLMTSIINPETFSKRYAVIGATFVAIQLTTTYLPAAAAFSLPLVAAVTALAIGCLGKELTDFILIDQ